MSNIKNKSFCSGDCPDYVNLTSAPQTTNYQAAKAINLLPNFVAINGTTFKAQIGCGNTTASIPKYQPLPVTTSAICPLDFDQSKNEINCFGTHTNFKVFIKNQPLGEYAEFSADGVNWTKANIDDVGFSVNSSLSPGQLQPFYVRPHSNPGNSIYGVLQNCP